MISRITYFCLLITLIACTTLQAQTGNINLIATGGNTATTLDWAGGVYTITSQVIYRDTDSNPVGRVQIAILPSTTKSYTDKNVVNGTLYYYWIEGTYSTGTTTSNAAQARPQTCTATPIVPYTQVNGGPWVQTANARVMLYGTVVFGPQPTTGGTWSWLCSNGATYSDRQITLGRIGTTQGGQYVARYTNASGCQTRFIFTITLDCGTTITPYTQVNGGFWQNTSSATLAAGGTVSFGPQATEGNWSWTGPNGFTASSREITIANVQTKQVGTYTATYSDSRQCPTTRAFTIALSSAQVANRTASLSEQVALYPNPVSTGKVTIKTILNVESAVQIQLIDKLGVIVQTVELAQQPSGTFVHSLSVAALPEGAYWARMRSAAGIATKRIIVLK